MEDQLTASHMKNYNFSFRQLVTNTDGFSIYRTQCMPITAMPGLTSGQAGPVSKSSHATIVHRTTVLSVIISNLPHSTSIPLPTEPPNKVGFVRFGAVELLLVP